MHHFHIRWMNGKLDWEIFPTREHAEESARQLAQPGESFAVEEIDGLCPQCASQPRYARELLRSKSA